VVQPIKDEPHVIVNVQPNVAITTTIVTRITNDELVEFNYGAPVIENDIEEQRQVDDSEDEFEKNQDVGVVDDIGSENDIHEHQVANVCNDIEHEQEIVPETPQEVSQTHPISVVLLKKILQLFSKFFTLEIPKRILII
jgi:hypothetical protein